MFENNVYVQNFNKYTFLLTELIKRDISGKYKDSTLGLFWSFLNPLLSMIVLTMVFSLIFANTIENFPVYLLSGKLVFDLFANATTGAMDSIKANSEIIKKIYVPKYMFAVGIVCSEFINFLISLVVLVAVMIFTGAPFHFALIYSPIPYGVLVMLLSFMTPLFYPIDIIPQQFLFAYKLNPLYSAVECFRNIILGGTFPDTWPFVFLIVTSIISLVIGVYVFFKYQDKFVLNI